MNLKNKLTLALLLTLTACSSSSSQLGYNRVFLGGVPQGRDSFSQGWRDGCDTSMAIVGSGKLRFVEEKLNGATANRFSRDITYDKGFNIGSGYCTTFLDYNSG